jgi:hypothetical protein
MRTQNEYALRAFLRQSQPAGKRRRRQSVDDDDHHDGEKHQWHKLSGFGETCLLQLQWNTAVTAAATILRGAIHENEEYTEEGTAQTESLKILHLNPGR